MRGSRTHGRGRKHGRGAGDRGGRGNAGLLKHKFKWTVKYDPDHFGRHGFVRHHDGEREIVVTDLEALEANLDTLVASKAAKVSGDVVEVDLTKAGIDKLLGSGRATRALKINVARATPKAVEKVTTAGGEITTDEGA